MSSQRLKLGAALFLAYTIAACSDADGSSANAQNRVTAPSDASRSLSLDHDVGGRRHSQFVFGPAPAIFPKGALFAVVQGDPGAVGKVFTVRLIFPNGYVLPPHTHPEEEHVTVLRGTFFAGMGPDFSVDSLTPLREGNFMTMPKDAPHFAKTRGVTEVQVHGIGPFQLTYVHPEDDPTK
jgi:quercetin dioxygenase-like cupin family protein